MDDLVEVLDMTFYIAVPAASSSEPAKLQYTVREHLGDVIKVEPGMTTITYAPKDIVVGLEQKRISGRRITLQSAHIVAIEREHRMEPRVRPSAKALASRELAEQEALKARLGIN